MLPVSPRLSRRPAGRCLAGCATVTDSRPSRLEVHTILDHREVAGVGCVLSNKHGPLVRDRRRAA